jgi:hypothetical protein
MARPSNYDEQVVVHSPLVIIEIWLFTIVVPLVIISGLFLFRDWLYETFGVYGELYVPTPAHTSLVHPYSGFALIVIGLLHLLLHFRSTDKSLLPVRTRKYFQDFLHAGFHLIGMSRVEVRGKSGKFNGRQRITYIAFLYIAGLSAITGILYFIGVLGHSLAFVHVLPGGLTFMVVLFQFLIIIRTHDLNALKCRLLTGKLPVWYLRKMHPIWYEELTSNKK